jgi:fatty acid desaturase
VLARFTALSINPQFRRQLVPAEMPRSWKITELAASAWAITVILLVAGGAVSLHTTLIIFLITSAIAVINQIRTLTAHLWESDGSQLSVTAQYLDSTNFPPPSLLPALWAPVGLRYHALHHLLPSLPYHSLAGAHRRLTAKLNPDSPYHRASYYRWSKLLKRIVSFQG